MPEQGCLNQEYAACRICPRNCGTDRRAGKGRCGCGDTVRAARAGLHYYEEPFLSGVHGSGTVFFSGCSLGCVYCQNGQISHEHYGWDISVRRLARIFLEQQGRKAHNINLVTGTHFIPSIAQALHIAGEEGLTIPVVWNSSGYEKPEYLQMLNGLVDIFLPDCKTLSPELGMRYFNAPDYPEVVREAISCMVEMTGEPEFVPLTAEDLLPQEQPDACYAGEGVLMKRGVVVRHLVIPGQTEDTKAVLAYLSETWGDKIWISLMSQYTPMPEVMPDAARRRMPELCRTVSPEEYDEAVDYAIRLGIENCMIQEGDTASDSFIPVFDGTGIRTRN